jgi:hypothetical protein
MLPPFVPPSARASAEVLPLITEFVVDRVDRSFEATFIPEAEYGGETEVLTSAPVIEFALPGTLPSIEEFVMRDPYVERPGAAAVSSESETTPLVQLQHAQSQGALTEQTTEQPETVVEPPSQPVTQPAQDWIEAERDAFDWQSMAHLAPDNDAQRANDDWTSTDWDAPAAAASSTADHIAAMLMQVARRVRSGELKINAPRGMTTEVALAAALTALLAEPDTGAGARGQE